MFDALEAKGFQIALHSHAAAILCHDFPDAISEIEETLANIAIPISEIIGSGGGEAKVTQRLRHALAQREWVKTNFVIEKTINGRKAESRSHEVDHVREFPAGMIALEIEWNNKDPFFDRDLENFKRLHAEGAISIGVIVTRGTSLQNDIVGLVHRFAVERGLASLDQLRDLGLTPTPRQARQVTKRLERTGDAFAEVWPAVFCSDKYGQATTHWRKLEDRIHRGVGNPCPLLLIGLPSTIVSFEEAAPAIADDLMDDIDEP